MEVKRAQQVQVPTETHYGEKKVYLHPGHIYVTDQPVDVTTVVGSCVSVCLWDRETRWAGINHYVLPAVVGGAPSMKHGDVAMHALIERLIKEGATPRTLRARLFGGSCVIEAFRGTGTDLGSKNVGVARRVLAHHRIPILQEDVGGGTGRKLVFHAVDGTVDVKLL
jgi:chemotaxis protein CheD